MYLNYLANLSHYIPELIVCMTMFFLILLESTYNRRDRKRILFNIVVYGGLAIALLALLDNFPEKPASIFTNTIAIDPFSTMIKIIMTLGTLGTIYLGNQSKDIDEDLKSEFAIISVGVLVGGMLLASATNMLILYIGMETLSILSYVLASLRKNDERSSEAGLKYSLYGGVSAGIMLFGISHIYGVTGTIHFQEIATSFKNLGSTEVMVIMPAFVLFFVGLGYKIACVPFHMWSPDVYEGSPLPITAFFSIVPKMAGMAAIIRISLNFFGQDGGILQDSWIGLLVVVSALTMTVGNVSAIGQKSIKRMLAYSSIGHVGMMLMGIVVLNSEGIEAVLFYGITYLFMTLVAFYIVGAIANEYGNEDFERFNGLVYRHPLMAIMLSVVMFSLAGIPPLGGFIAKFNILAIIIDEKHYTLALIAGINSVIALYYYLRLVRLMVLKPAEGEDSITFFKGYWNQGLIVIMTMPVIFLGIFWSGTMRIIHEARILAP